jgi:hypothetical protein
MLEKGGMSAPPGVFGGYGGTSAPSGVFGVMVAPLGVYGGVGGFGTYGGLSAPMGGLGAWEHHRVPMEVWVALDLMEG